MDRVGNLLTSIKNGYLASLKEVSVPYSNLSVAILELLQKEGFIAGFKPAQREIKVTLRYEGIKPALTDVKRISKPSHRVYMGKKFLPWVYDGLGIAVVSTPKGVMSDKQARKEGVGGEVMAFVW